LRVKTPRNGGFDKNTGNGEPLQMANSGAE
jgi:hypothetical protein